MYMAVWGVLPHSNSIFYRIFVNYTSDFRHFPKNRRFASGGGWQNGAFVHFAVGVCRFGRRLDLPSLYPAGGACLLCRLLPPAFSLLSCPLSPQPALAERSSPAGKGEPQSIFRRGLRPRHPCAEPLAALTEPSTAVPSGEACLLCRLLPPAFSLLSCPLSPQPALAERSSPAGKGEPQSLFRRGLRPRHPCTKPLAAPTEPASAVPGGGLPGWSPA